MFVNCSILILLFAGMCIREIIPSKQVVAPVSKASFGEKEINAITTTLIFDRDIKPIFQKRCNPCHFPGGKLYDRLPFDQASTIIKNEKGILPRIKDTDEVKMIRQFVEENSAATEAQQIK